MSNWRCGDRILARPFQGLLSLVAGVCGAAPLAAQSLPPGTPALPSQSDISRQRVPMPLPLAEPKFDFRIQAPERSAVPKAVDAIEFTLSRVEVEGVTVFPKNTVDEIFAPLTQHVVHLDEVRAAAAKLEAMYRARGYFLSRVFVPPQRVEEGKLLIRTVEGYISSVRITGLDARSRAAAYRQLRKVMERKPIDLATIERLLLILNDTPGVTATSVLQQGSELGASEMLVTLDRPSTVFQTSINNSNSLILGPWTYGVNAIINRPLGLPGALSLGGAVSGPGFGATQSGNMRYSMGIGSHGLVASAGVLVALAHPGASLIPLNVRNRLVSVSARLRYPLIRSRARSLYLEGGLALSRSLTDILGQRISEDRETVGDIGLTFQEARLLNGSITATANVFRGLRILGASDRSALRPSVAGFNPNFTRLTFSLQRQQNLVPRVGALVAVQGQYSGSKLLSGETIAFGGPAIGRGYDPSTIIGDRGIGGVVELRYDLPLAKAWLSGAQFYGFADTAKATSLAGPTTPASRERSRSVGGGVRFIHPRFTASVEVAKALVQVSGSDQRANPRVLMSLSSSF